MKTSRNAVILTCTFCSLLCVSCLFSGFHPSFTFLGPSSPCDPLDPSLLASASLARQSAFPWQPSKHRSLSSVSAFASGPLHRCLAYYSCMPRSWVNWMAHRFPRTATDLHMKTTLLIESWNNYQTRLSQNIFNLRLWQIINLLASDKSR